MKNAHYRITFVKSAPMSEISETLVLSELAVRHLYGREAVRLDARYTLDIQNNTCEIDATSKPGRALAKIFTGFITLEFGTDAYKVERVAA